MKLKITLLTLLMLANLYIVCSGTYAMIDQKIVNINFLSYILVSAAFLVFELATLYKELHGTNKLSSLMMYGVFIAPLALAILFITFIITG